MNKLTEFVNQFAPNAKIIRTWPLPGGISAEMNALEIETADGQTQKVILRQPGTTTLEQNPLAAENEFKLLQWARTHNLATPKPIFLDLSTQFYPTPTLVIEYIEGKTEFSPVNPLDYARQAATHLAHIHQAGYTKADLAFLPCLPQEFKTAFGSHAPQAAPWFEVERIRKLLKNVWPLESKNTPVLLHGDFWPGNLLWLSGRLVAVIDWEDAAFGEPLSDLGLSRLDFLWIFGLEAMNTFTESYLALNPIDASDLPYWDLAAAHRLARLAGPDLDEWVAFFPPFGRSDISVETISAQYRGFITQAMER